MIRAVTFDAGATLLHPDPPVAEIYVREFERDGVPGVRASIGAALARTWEEIRRRDTPDRYGGTTGERHFWETFVRRTRFHLDRGEVSDRCFALLVSHFSSPAAWSVYADVVPALDELRARGFSLAIVSNWDSSLPALLDANSLSARFDAILVSGIEGTGKPGGEIFLRACRRLGVEPEEALHVGDSREEDYEAARAAGLCALLLDRNGVHPAVEQRVTSLGEVAGVCAPAPAARR